MHATEFLKQPDCSTLPGFVVLAGDQAQLKRDVLERIGRDWPDRVRLEGAQVDWREAHDELQMRSLWGEPKLVIVTDGDEFVTRHRGLLEKHVERAAQQSVLVLDVKTWRSNTRLAKLVKKSALAIECSELKGRALEQWLAQAADATFDRQLTRDAASLLVELAGTDLGLLDQQLAKLAAYVGDRQRITVEDVRTLVGDWRTETTWAMLDAIRLDRVGEGLAALDKLLTADEPPLKILGGIAFVYRKYARATELARQGKALPAALKAAGVFPREVASAERYLRRLGRPQAERILERLQAADQDLKGAAAIPERLVLERLLLQLARGPALV